MIPSVIKMTKVCVRVRGGPSLRATEGTRRTFNREVRAAASSAMASRSPRTTLRPSLPRPRLVFPRFSTRQIFEVFSLFLAKHELTCTRSMLSKELVARGLAEDVEAGVGTHISEAALREHLAFCVAQLTSLPSGGVAARANEELEEEEEKKEDAAVAARKGVGNGDGEEEEYLERLIHYDDQVDELDFAEECDDDHGRTGEVEVEEGDDAEAGTLTTEQRSGHTTDGLLNDHAEEDATREDVDELGRDREIDDDATECTNVDHAEDADADAEMFQDIFAENEEDDFPDDEPVRLDGDADADADSNAAVPIKTPSLQVAVDSSRRRQGQGAGRGREPSHHVGERGKGGRTGPSVRGSGWDAGRSKPLPGRGVMRGGRGGVGNSSGNGAVGHPPRDPPLPPGPPPQAALASGGVQGGRGVRGGGVSGTVPGRGRGPGLVMGGRGGPVGPGGQGLGGRGGGPGPGPKSSGPGPGSGPRLQRRLSGVPPGNEYAVGPPLRGPPRAPPPGRGVQPPMHDGPPPHADQFADQYQQPGDRREPGRRGDGFAPHAPPVSVFGGVGREGRGHGPPPPHQGEEWGAPGGGYGPGPVGAAGGSGGRYVVVRGPGRVPGPSPGGLGRGQKRKAPMPPY